MDLRKELRWIAEAQNKQLPWNERYADEKIPPLVEKVQSDYDNGRFNFAKFIEHKVPQGDKKRKVKTYSALSIEALLSIYLHRKLKWKFRVEFPNRNTYIRSLFDTVCALKDMSDYTVYKFDFANFFESVSSVYVFRRYIQDRGLERYQEDLLEKYVTETEYAYAGLCVSNVICEIAARRFDDLLRQSCVGKGLIYYRRYIDDGILIFNRCLTAAACEDLVQKAIDKAFYDGADTLCKTALKKEKTRYIARRDLNDGSAKAFDFLGYEFSLSGKKEKQKERTIVTYGITAEKREKYKAKITEIMEKHRGKSDSRDLELLRHQLRAFSHRTVYMDVRKKQTIWINKGFLANYHELGNHLEQLSDETRDFLQNVIYDEAEKVFEKIPYFLKDSKNTYSTYSLYNNLRRNKALVFVERIGISHQKLQAMCEEVGIDPNFSKKYDTLLRAYLNKVGVGY